MTHHYRISEPSSPAAETATRSRGTWLWVLLVLALVANVTLSAAGLNLLAVPAGLAVIATGTVLFLRHRGRQS